jgi:hypothetical protein
LDQVVRARKPRRAVQLTPSHPIPRAGRRAARWSWEQRRGKLKMIEVKGLTAGAQPSARDIERKRGEG